MRQRKRVAAAVALFLAVVACAQPPAGVEPEPSTAPSTARPTPEVVSCEDIDTPYAPEDWYADTPIYVGNEMPIDEVRVFAQTLDGFRDVWIDRAHHGWIGVGFDNADVESHQAALKAEFPGAGVVAVDMPYTRGELEDIGAELASRLPDGVEVVGVDDLRGYLEVFVGPLTAENVAAAREAVAEVPACIAGIDPSSIPAPGPPPDGGNGWAYLGEADTMLDSEYPRILADAGELATVWGQLGLEGTPPSVDFDQQVALYLVIGHSGSCPETRLDDLVVDGALVYAVVPSITELTEELACTADWVPRTYLVAVDRALLPGPPFQLTAEKEYGARVEVTADLRVPGSAPGRGEVSPAEIVPVRELTPMPYWIETEFPWPLTMDPSCGVDYLGLINDVHWHRADGTGMPEQWTTAVVDGLLDLELMMTPGPEPTLTASAGGVDVLYLPGPSVAAVCD